MRRLGLVMSDIDRMGAVVSDVREPGISYVLHYGCWLCWLVLEFNAVRIST